MSLGSILFAIESEMLEDGRPTRREMIWTILATLIVILQIGANINRIIDWLSGGPLFVSNLIGITIVQSDPWSHIAGAVAFHIVLFCSLGLILWACLLQYQRWWFWRNRS
jgi:hypothetical protein